MRISSIFYCIRQGLKNIWRNKLFSIASIATMAACIFLFGIFFCIVENVQYMVREAEKSVAVTVFFDEDLSEAEILAIGERIEDRDEVSYINYVAADEAWEEYQEIYFADAPELAEGFADDNPLANSSHYEIYLTDVESQEDLVNWLESVNGIRKINESAQVADILSSFNMLIGYISVAIIVLLLAVSVFLINNMVSIGISVRREEIGIMKLIGATNTFVNAPFIVEGLIIGLIGAAIPLGLLYVLYVRLDEYLLSSSGALSGLLQLLPVGDMMQILLPVGMILGVGIGFFGSFFAIRRHLKV